VVAIVGALALVVHRVGAHGRARGEETDPTWPAPIARLVGLALVPIGVGWFVAHDLTLLLAEGQNFYALLSDPLGRGWDLFGTLNHTIDFSIVEAGWVRWTRMLALLAGQLAAVVLAHDGALRLLRRRDADRTTWAMGGVAAVSVIAGALLALT
jgi:hypothetical protein